MVPDNLLKSLPLDEKNFGLLAEIFDAVPAPIILKKIKDGEVGEFLIWNRSAEGLLGIPASESIGARDEDVFPAEQAARFSRQDDDVVKSGRPLVIPSDLVISRTRGLRYLRTTKSPIFDSESQPIALLVVSEDITESERTKRDLRQALEFIHHVNSQVPGVVFQFCADANGRPSFRYMSEGIRSLTGDDAEEIVAGRTSFLRRILPEDLPLFLSQIARSRRDGEACHLEFRLRTVAGELRWLMANAVPENAEDGSTTWYGFLSDVTDRYEIKQQLIEAKEAAERASEAKSEFLAMMSHEIRTPLNAVLGFSELLGALPLGKEEADHVQTIQDNSAALLVILNDVLDYSKIESGRLDLHPAPVDLACQVRSAVDFFRPQAAAKGISLQVKISPDFPRKLLCDAARFNQVLHNLLSNAVKFTEEGGVTIELGLDGPVNAGEWPVCLRVCDSGIGIALDRHPGLFDPFYQADSSTRRRFGGTGLGLAIVKRLAVLMGGGVDVQSASGKGSVFSLRVVLADPGETDESAVPIDGSVCEDFGNSSRILVVEDNRTNRRLVRLFLQRMGLKADEAEDGFAGVKLACANHYDVILMDLEMPGLDGLEATRRIREEDGGDEPYIVALTAHAMLGHRERSIEAGMDAYLSKPVKLTDLKEVLVAAANRSR